MSETPANLTGRVPSREDLGALIDGTASVQQVFETRLPFLAMYTDPEGKTHPPVGLGQIDWAHPENAGIVRGVNYVTDSCFTKGLTGGVLGYFMGGAFGLFMAAFTQNSQLDPKTLEMSTKDQMKAHFKLTRWKMGSWAKTFGELTMVWQGIECCVEKARGSTDAWNGGIAGFCTGALLQYNQAPSGRIEKMLRIPVKSMVGNGMGLFAFSFAIDWYMDPHGLRTASPDPQLL